MHLHVLRTRRHFREVITIYEKQLFGDSLLCAAAAAAGLYPSDALDAAKCDAIMDCAGDFYVNARPSFMEKDETKKVLGKNR